MKIIKPEDFEKKICAVIVIHHRAAGGMWHLACHIFSMWSLMQFHIDYSYSFFLIHIKFVQK